jgi:Myb-like DNA-binding domain
MPKQPNARKTARVAPYPLSTTSNMASQVTYYPMSAQTPISSHTPTDWSSTYTYTPQHPLMQLPEVMNPMPPTPHNLAHPSASPQLAQTGPWTTEEDEILCDCRTRGFGWSQIQEKHFPGKSANACRKRHERLMTKRRSTDWDESRLENLAVNYRQMRGQIWAPLAERLGEKWEHVEKAVRAVAVDTLSVARC